VQDIEGSSNDHFNVLIWYLPEETEENNEKSPSVEMRTFRTEAGSFEN
jgi:hypothetical protein